MKFDLINTLIIINLFLILLEYSYKKSEFIYVFILSFLILSILIYKEVLLCYLFNLDLWKLIFIFLIIFLYFIILDLIEDKNFDIYCLVTLVFLGSFILVTCDNLLTLYLGLELQTFSIFILIAKNRLSIKSSEAGLKYFILGALSSGFYLLGLTMMFLLGYSLNLSDINFISMEFLNTISLIFITLSFCFKLSLFPLHF
jgi:NADH-quinone oxidoreductase subunit N